MDSSDRRTLILRQAWTGDAVLSLYVRQRILAEGNGINNEKAVRMSSNQFLSHFGDASEVEAKIGIIYESDGLGAAFAWIEANLIPLFDKIEAKRLPPRGQRR